MRQLLIHLTYLLPPWLAIVFLMRLDNWPFPCPSRVSLIQRSICTQASVCSLSCDCTVHIAMPTMFYVSPLTLVSHATSQQCKDNFSVIVSDAQLTWHSQSCRWNFTMFVEWTYPLPQSLVCSISKGLL